MMLCISYPRRPRMLSRLSYEDVLDITHDPTGPACGRIIVPPDISTFVLPSQLTNACFSETSSIPSSCGGRGLPSSILDLNGTAGNELEIDPRHVFFWEGLLDQAVGILLSVDWQSGEGIRSRWHVADADLKIQDKDASRRADCFHGTRSAPSSIASRGVSPIRNLESRSFLARHFEPIV